MATTSSSATASRSSSSTGSGIRRKVDDLGRVVIPSSIRKILGIHEGDFVEVQLDGDRVVMSLPEDTCTFCGSTLHLESFRGKVVCWSCTAALRAKDRQREGQSDFSPSG